MNNAFEQFGWQQKQGGGSVETEEVLPHFLLLEFCYSGCLLLQHGRQRYCKTLQNFYLLSQLDCWNIDLEKLVAILFILLLCDACLVNLL